MKKFIRLFSLLICIAITVSMFAGCGGGADTPSPSANSPAPVVNSPANPNPTTPTPPPEAKYKDNLVYLAGSPIPVIDLFNPASTSNQLVSITFNAYNRLVYRTVDNEFEPELAVSWKTDDYKTVNFKLRDDVYFHNGEKFTAKDVKWTFDTAKKSVGSKIFDILNKVESVEVVNDYEINVVFTSVNVDYLYDLSTQTYGILNEKAYSADKEKGPWVGTGPWIITKVAPEVIAFTRNEDYWGEVPVTKTMEFKYVAEVAARLIMLENDEVDIMIVDPMMAETYKKDPRFTIWEYIGNSASSFAFNFNNPITADKNFRLAVAHAFNADECNQFTLSGTGLAAPSAAFWGLYTEFRRDDLPRYKYDPELAKEYLAKSNYNGETVEILVGPMVTVRRDAQVMQQALQAIGVKAEIFETDGATVAQRSAWGNKDTQIVCGTSFNVVAPSGIRTFAYPGYTANKSNYDNARMKELIDLGDVTLDKAEREKIYHEIQQILADDVVYLTNYHQGMAFAGQEGCGGAVLFPDAGQDLSHYYRVIG